MKEFVHIGDREDDKRIVWENGESGDKGRERPRMKEDSILE